MAPRGEISYVQVTRPIDDPDLGPPVEIIPKYQADLLEPPLASLQQWTNELVRRIVKSPQSGLDAMDLNTGPRGERIITLPDRREKVARALCNHLRHSGEYTYTLDLRRQDHDIDPTEDFLRNVKQGHCERYAAGLTLMLRGLEIPARIVKGFRGCTARGDGTYFVRNSDAHVWVEALVPRITTSGRIQMHWLALDPTPSEGAPPASPFSLGKWWENCRNYTGEFWRVFVAEYGSEEQSALANAVRDKLSPSHWASGNAAASGRISAWLLTLPLPAVVGIGIYLARRRRRQAVVRSGSSLLVHFYARLLDLLARHLRMRPLESQTPREFGATAERLLQTRDATAALADLPNQVAALYYRVRYGGATLTATEQAGVDRRLDDLAAALGQVAAASAHG
jgi:hypothetical protein